MASYSVVGKSLPRVDVLEKATGEAVYCGDIKLPRMLYARVLRSPYPHARIISIDTTKAEQLPGVLYVATGKDAPDKKFGAIIHDDRVLPRQVVRAIGAPVAAVAAESIDTAQEALELIDVQYEELPAIFDPEEAMSTNPPVVIHPDLANYEVAVPHYYRLDKERPNVFMHFQVRHGDVEKGFKEADLVLENRFSTAKVQQCAIEPHVCIARAEADGGLTMWLSNQCVQARRADLSRLFDIKPSKVRVIQPYLGGGFGGKATLREETIAALLALKTGRPVKLEATREEVFLRGGMRPTITIFIKDGFKKDGTIVARQMKAVIGAGGSAESNIASVTRNCAFGAIGTYKLENFKWDSYGVYLNEPIVNPFRGFGNTQVVFAIESHMDMAADKLGIDRIAIRKRNILKEGDKNATGEIVHSIGNEKCLDEVAEFIKLNEKSAPEGVWRKGKGISVGNKYSLAPSASSARIKVTEEGNIIVYHGSSELGQGCDTVMAQIAAEEFGIPFDRVSIAYSDSLYMPYDFGTISSRATYHMGNAVILACRDAKRQLFERVGKRLDTPPEELETRDGVVFARGAPEKNVMIPELFAGYEPGKYGAYTPGGEIIGNATFVQDFIPEDEETGQIDPKLAAEGKRLNAFYGHTAKAVEVAVNTETGEVKVIKCAGADDMGRPINPKMCEQQQDSGLAMGIGSAIYEEVKLDKGRVLNPNFTDYRVVTAGEMPAIADMQTMIGAVPHKDGPYGAKGFAEGVMIGVDAAVANAVYDAVGIRIKELPLNAEKVLKALEEKG